MASINNQLFSFFVKSTDNSIGETGATSLSEALKSNTTLKVLHIGGEDKRNNTQMASINNQLISILIKSTGNWIREGGATSLSDALKSNTTLIELKLNSVKAKESNTQMASINKQLFSILIKLTANKIGERGATSLSDALKSNATLIQLELSCEHKRNNTQITSINNQLFSILIKFTGNEIRDAGTASLSDALKSNTTLTELL